MKKFKHYLLSESLTGKIRKGKGLDPKKVHINKYWAIDGDLFTEIFLTGYYKSEWVGGGLGSRIFRGVTKRGVKGINGWNELLNWKGYSSEQLGMETKKYSGIWD